MTDMPTADVEVLYKGWARWLRALIRLPSGESYHRELEDHGDGVAVLPYDPVRRLAVVVRQLRAGPLVSGADDPFLTEAPAGVIDPGEDAAAAGRREVEEEAGIVLGALEPAGAPWSMPGLSTERIHLFLAEYGAGDRVGPGGGLACEHENIEVTELALDDLAAQADAGAIRDMKSLALIQTLRLRRPQLFS